ncbi:MAG: hypothetical protein C5B58_16500 [Acidobacteria bacterium]|nr:MAG: hypothetical protein C5B58_16500 [Acidobacteriota bacterium]
MALSFYRRPSSEEAKFQSSKKRHSIVRIRKLTENRHCNERLRTHRLMLAHRRGNSPVNSWRETVAIIPIRHNHRPVVGKPFHCLALSPFSDLKGANNGN